jgi:hypothetical protein
MNYTKPEVAVLGEATSLIESYTGKGMTHAGDGSVFPVINPAYDLDE